MNANRIARVSGSEMKRTKGETDWQRVRGMTDEAVAGAAKADLDAPPTTPEFWQSARLVVPAKPKKQITLRLDSDIVEWFKAQGSRYQTRMNAVLRAFMEAKQRDRGGPQA